MATRINRKEFEEKFGALTEVVSGSEFFVEETIGIIVDPDGNLEIHGDIDEMSLHDADEFQFLASLAPPSPSPFKGTATPKWDVQVYRESLMEPGKKYRWLGPLLRTFEILVVLAALLLMGVLVYYIVLH